MSFPALPGRRPAPGQRAVWWVSGSRIGAEETVDSSETVAHDTLDQGLP